MHNNTEDDYKEGVKNRYELVKNEIHATYLIAPTRAKLSKLCWEIFEGEKMHQSDLNVFNTLLGLPFDINKKNEFKKHKDKFRPIETFFKGETNPLEIDKVDLAAVLVDFQPRPFSRFRTSDLSLDYNGLGISSDPEFAPQEEHGNSGTKKPVSTEGRPARKFKFLREIIKGSKKETAILVGIIIMLLFTFSYLNYFKKACMQWSEDHYEIVYCDKPMEGNFNDVVELDDDLLNFKKINVCDTTNCFKPDGEAIVWYAKTDKGVDFFNANGYGRHPETKKALRPVSEYIRGKYKKPCGSK